MKTLFTLIIINMSACAYTPGIDQTTEPDASTVETVTIGHATCTPTDRASIGVKAAPGTTFQLFLDDTSAAYDCTGQAPGCWCIGGGNFPLDTYDCQSLTQAER